MTDSPASTVDLATIQAAMQQPRPGLAAQMQMAPRPRAPVAETGPARVGAVLLLLYPVAGRLHLVLTRRSNHVQSHRGQISLPGGKQEPGETFEETALREAHEELNLDPSRVQILGRLTPLYISASHFLIWPIVGYCADQPKFIPDPYEVAEVLEIPLEVLLDPESVRQENWPLRGTQVHVPFFQIGAEKIWGATAMVLAEFVELIRQARA